MPVPRKIPIHIQKRNPSTSKHTTWVQYIILDREVLTPSPCEQRIDTDVNSHAYETVMESYANIPLDDKSHFLLVSNVLFPPGCVNPFHTNFKQYIPLAAKDLSVSLGSKNQNIPLIT